MSTSGSKSYTGRSLSKSRSASQSMQIIADGSIGNPNSLMTTPSASRSGRSRSASGSRLSAWKASSGRRHSASSGSKYSSGAKYSASSGGKYSASNGSRGRKYVKETVKRSVVERVIRKKVAAGARPEMSMSEKSLPTRGSHTGEKTEWCLKSATEKSLPTRGSHTGKKTEWCLKSTTYPSKATATRSAPKISFTTYSKSSSSVTPSVEQGYSTRMKIPGFSTVQDRRVVKSAPKIKGTTKSWSAVSKTKPAPAPKTKIVERIVYKEKSRRKSVGDIEEGGRRSSGIEIRYDPCCIVMLVLAIILVLILLFLGLGRAGRASGASSALSNGSAASSAAAAAGAAHSTPVRSGKSTTFINNVVVVNGELQ